MPSSPPSQRDYIAVISSQLVERTPRAIASTVAELIRAGAIPVGAQLPTVRELAAALRVSPATISNAWGLLRSRGTVLGRGRAGTWVADSSRSPRRFEQMGRLGSAIRWDLAALVPDPALLPELRPALVAGSAVEGLNGYAREAIIGPLQDAVEERWPFPAETLLATNSGTHALYLVLRTLTVPGDRVVVETPTSTPLLAILADLQVQLVELAVDEDGPLPESLRAALVTRPSVVIYQPRAQVPLGHAVSAERIARLAGVLTRFSGTVLEYDDFGELSLFPAASMGAHRPASTVLIRSFSKSHGPDLRLAVVGGPAALLGDVHARMLLSTRWASRVMQGALAWMLESPVARDQVETARAVYAERREGLAAALAAAGTSATGRDGLGLWVPVADERVALATLAGEGIAVVAGSSAFVAEGAPHIRVSTSLLRGEREDLAVLIARAAQDP